MGVDSVGMHARLLQEHSELHGRHAQDLEEQKYLETERFNYLEKELVEKQARSIEERFNCLEKELADSVGMHARLLQEHSELHGKHAQDLEERKYLGTERFNCLEKELEEKQARSNVERFNCLEKELVEKQA